MDVINVSREDNMHLYYTPRSHFSRKVRILLGALGLDVELIDIGNVGSLSKDMFGSNPLMKVPVFIDKDCAIFDSDHIAHYLVRTYGRDDPFSVLTTDIHCLNARAIMNGAMSAGVEVVLAERSGIDTNAYQRFNKLREVIINSLNWLEANAVLFEGQPNYLSFHLTCLWDHVALYNMVPLDYSQLKECVLKTSSLPFVKSTAPE